MIPIFGTLIARAERPYCLLVVGVIFRISWALQFGISKNHSSVQLAFICLYKFMTLTSHQNTLLLSQTTDQSGQIVHQNVDEKKQKFHLLTSSSVITIGRPMMLLLSAYFTVSDMVL